VSNPSWSLPGSLLLLAGVAVLVCWPEGSSRPEPPRGTVAPAVEQAPAPIEAVIGACGGEELAEGLEPITLTLGEGADSTAGLERVLELADDPCSAATRELIAIYLDEDEPAPGVRAACAEVLAQRELTPEQVFDLRSVNRGHPSE